MLNFFRKLAGHPPAEPKEQVERLYRIPDEYAVEVLELLDKSRVEGKVGRYRLWKRLEEIYPPSKEGAWELDTRNATNIYLVMKPRWVVVTTPTSSEKELRNLFVLETIRAAEDGATEIWKDGRCARVQESPAQIVALIREASK